MALRDLFKRKKESKEEKKKEIPKPKAEKKTAKPSVLKSKKTYAYRILQGPHVTEKAGDLEKENKYVFRVYPGANKIEIKKAVQGLYGVGVESVRIIKVPSKTRVFKGRKGMKKGYKKAIVKVREGQKIEVISR